MKMILKTCANPKCGNTFSINAGNPQKSCCTSCAADCGIRTKKETHTMLTKRFSKKESIARRKYYETIFPGQ